MLKRVIIFFVAILLISNTSLRAEESKSAELYGDGVHAYFANQYEKAMKKFDQSIATATKNDPRVYYFRGLTHWQLNDRDKAKADFKTAAKIESEDQNGLYSVSRTLIRVQGEVRLEIEKHRKQGLIDKRNKEIQLAKKRYEASKSTGIKPTIKPIANPDASDEKVAGSLFNESDELQEFAPIEAPTDGTNKIVIKPDVDPTDEKNNPFVDENSGTPDNPKPTGKKTLFGALGRILDKTLKPVTDAGKSIQEGIPPLPIPGQ